MGRAVGIDLGTTNSVVADLAPVTDLLSPSSGRRPLADISLNAIAS